MVDPFARIEVLSPMFMRVRALLPVVLLVAPACHAEAPLLPSSVGMMESATDAPASTAIPVSERTNASITTAPHVVAVDAIATPMRDEPIEKAAAVTDKPATPSAHPAEGQTDAATWITGEEVGYGIATKETGNPRGHNIFVGCAGYGITLDAAEAWVSALYRDSLKDRGVRRLYAIQGPADVLYSQYEIGNSRVATSLVAEASVDTNFILIVAHSSGTYVAHELLNQLATGLDPTDKTRDKIVYFDLDGGDLGLSQTAIDRVRRAYFVVAFDPTTNTYSPNQDSMVSGASTWPEKGGYFQESLQNTGCNAGASWCLHMALITTQPHDPTKSDALVDYSDFAGRAVAHGYIDEKASDAGLNP